MSGRMSFPPDGDPPAEPAPTAVVAALVVVSEGMDPTATLAALDAQVYAPGSVLLVGARPIPGEHQQVATLLAALGRLDETAAYVWIVHGDARPRPDALAALIDEAERNDAAVAGSKILTFGGELTSVGWATDVFGEPFSGLDPGELDLEQYDVVREVAFVSSVSLLVRRDLYRGLGGLDPRLPAQAAGLDFCQRARVAGARVIVVPSSEVFHDPECVANRPGWRQMAGRQKAMLTVYRPITLLWVLPVGLLASLADSLGRLALGRVKPLFQYLAGWGWNLLRLPSTIRGRRSLRRIRQAGDEELFRFQVNGSVRLRTTMAEIGERLARVVDITRDDPLATPRWRRPAALWVMLGVLALAVGCRTLWLSGLPEAGFALLPAADPRTTLAAYTGSWNPVGLGTPNPPPPVTALGTLAAAVVGGRPGLAATLLTLAAVIGGFTGMMRLNKRLGGSASAGYAAGFVYLGGAAAGAIFAAGNWPLLLAAGPLPWAFDSVMAVSQTAPGRQRAGLLARGGLAAGLATVAFPPALGVVLVGGAGWALLSRRGTALLPTAVITICGLLAIAPWVVGGELIAFLEANQAGSIHPGWLWPALIGLAVAVGALVADERFLRVLAWAGIAAGAGWAISLAPRVPAGTAVAALLAASLGAGIIAAVVANSLAGPPFTRLLAAGALTALLIPVIPMLAGGRLGLPADMWHRRLEFVGALGTSTDLGRVLLMGSAAELPGASRALGPVSFRLLDGEDATLDQAYLPGPRGGDYALAQTLADIAAGSTTRPGSLLADYGIAWIVLLPDVTEFDHALGRQVDLVPRPVDPVLRVFENSAYRGRGITTEGEVWERADGRYLGTAAPGRVRLADNADPGWGPDWQPADWANSVSTRNGFASFAGSSLLMSAAAGSVVVWLVMIVLAWRGRAES
jgi:hypothetical protein